MSSAIRITKYSLVGAGLLFFNYLLFWVVYFSLAGIIELWSIGVVQYVISVLVSHHVYRRLVFHGAKERYIITLSKYIVSTIVIAAISLSLLLIGHDLLGFNIFISQGISLGATLGIGFLLGARFTFRQKSAIVGGREDE